MMFGTVGMAQVAVMNNGFNIVRRGGGAARPPEDPNKIPPEALFLLAILFATLIVAILIVTH